MALKERVRDQRGAAALEFALVAPMVFMLLFGTITSGISYSNAIGVTNAVREGARFGATGLYDSSNPTQWSDDVINRVRGTQFDDPSGETSVCVRLHKQGFGTVHSECSAGTAPVPTTYPAIPTGLTTGACVVLVVASRPYEINAVVAHFDDHLTRDAVSRYERDSC